MLVVQALVGGLLLTFGRRLFWLFVAACGFAIGLTLTTRFSTVRSEWLTLVVALGAGALCALLAVFFQRLAIGVAGFLAGALIVGNLFTALDLKEGIFFWVAFGIGGVLGATLMGVLFDWGLIALSSLAGSSLIVEVLQLPVLPGFLIWLALLGLGITVQVAQMRQRNRESRRQKP